MFIFSPKLKETPILDLYHIANAYAEACKKVEQLLKESAYKITWIMEELGLGRSAFYARLNAGNWEPQHLMVFGRILAEQPGKPRKGGSNSTDSAN